MAKHQEQRNDRPEVYALDTVLTFGKCKGQTVRWAIDNQLGWVKWAHRQAVEDKTFRFALDPFAMEYFLEKAIGKKPGGFRPNYR